MRWTLYLLSLICCMALDATQVMPWFGRDKEFEARFSYSNQNYGRISTVDGTVHQHSDDHFLAASLAISPFQFWAFEIETCFGVTDQKGSGEHYVKGTARYQWLDDVSGDFISLTTGISLSHACDLVFHDVSNCYHGPFEVEFHTAIGKEYACSELWDQRAWIVGGLGIATKGRPWLRLEGGWEKQWCEFHQLRFFCRSRWGLGDHGLDLVLAPPFDSYAQISYSSIEVGGRYTYLIESWMGSVSFEYARRILGKNFPTNVDFLTLEILYPFGL